MSTHGKVIAIAGHTASGKSSLALKIARRTGGEIVCCDSMQIYRGMDIGTAKPTALEMAEIPHHMVDIVSPSKPYSCAEYVDDAKKAIEDIINRGRLPIICGGTGLYLDCLLYPRPFEESGGHSEVRERLTMEAERDGAHALYLRLCAIDPESAATIHENNVRRVIRALEIFETTGKKKSELDRVQTPPYFEHLAFELRRTDINERYFRIESRIDEMLSGGLLDETRWLLESGVFDSNTTAAQAIGYKEMIPCVRGEASVEAAREKLIVATRQYAKRQVTWFSAKKYIETVGVVSGDDPTDDILGKIRDFLNS